MDRHQERADDEIAWRDLVRIAWQRRYLILTITAAFTLIAAFAAWMSPKEYEASIVISPVTSEAGSRMGALSSVMSQFGDLASLAGVSSPLDTKRAETLEVLKSYALTEQYIQQNQLLPILYSKEWNAAAQRWRISDPAQAPTLWKASRYFSKKIRTIDIDPKTNLVTLTIRWTNPEQAARWANGLVKMANDYTRQQAIAEAQRNIDYLDGQAAKTDDVGVRQEIYELLQTQISKMMLARGTEDYSLKVLDPAQPPQVPSSPLPKLWTAAGCVGGLLISLLIALALGESRRAPAAAAGALAAARAQRLAGTDR
jgi:uncharacterized protein involved in exopolysaccharide biosynthesis